MTVRPTFLPPHRDHAQEAGLLVLTDGSRLPLWRALPEDARRILHFLDRLESSERREVAASLRLEAEDLASFLEEVAEARRGEAFFAEETSAEERVAAFAAYRLLQGDEAGEEQTAAITLAVAPALRRHGTGTLLLERLCVLAAQRGVARLSGQALTHNRPLIELFRKGGFEAEEHRDEDRVTFVLDPGTAAARPLGEHGEDVRARIFAAASLRPLFHPASVAVVGASRQPGAVGRRILDSLITAGFNGPVYPVNPHAHHVGSIRAYPSVAAIGEAVDLAVIAVPARIVPEAIEDCAAAGVRGLVLITAGFAEVGDEGKVRQQRLVEQIRQHGMRMVGPNCLGLLHTHPEVRLNASFAPRMPPPGNVALCSQSGALGIAIIALARRLGLGLSSFVSIGNKADITANDLLEYWEEDAETAVNLFYLESFGNPRRFARLARRVGRAKPIIVVKAGRTEAGGRAASSHTAALTAPETAVEALFRQTGIIRADTLEEMFGIARVLTQQPLPKGRRVAVVTNAGGPAILCTDALAGAGLRVETLADPTREALRELLPAEASTANPVDMIASAGPDTYRQAVETVLAAEEVDALVVVYTPAGMFDTGEVARAIAQGVVAARQGRGAGKPVLASVVGDEEALLTLQAGDGESLPVYSFPEEAGRVLGKMADYAAWRRADPGLFPEFEDQQLERAQQICQAALEERGAGWLAVDEARQVLAAAGLTLAAGGVAADADEAVAMAEEIGFPVAIKLASLTIAHKTEIGGVVLDLDSPAAVRRAVEKMAAHLEELDRREEMQGVLVQPMLKETTEVMIGIDLDPVFGPLIAFGLGGIYVEILRDVVFRVSPLTDRDAAAMVRGIDGFRLLEGYRGHPAADVAALEEALLRISRLVEAVPEIAELDLNPIFALEPGEGYRVVDARIKVA